MPRVRQGFLMKRPRHQTQPQEGVSPSTDAVADFRRRLRKQTSEMFAQPTRRYMVLQPDVLQYFDSDKLDAKLKAGGAGAIELTAKNKNALR